jgi:hypothetical protein
MVIIYYFKKGIFIINYKYIKLLVSKYYLNVKNLKINLLNSKKA